VPEKTLDLLQTHESIAAQSSTGLSRRDFCRTSALGAVAGVLSGIGVSESAHAEVPKNNRTLLKGGTVVSMDPKIGDFVQGDVLIDGSRIAAVGRNLPAGDATVISATNMIVCPGFIDTHRHLWAGQLRNSSPHGTEYLNYRDKCGPVYRPEDAYIGDMLSILSALDAGITTILDWSHIQNTPEHTDAVIRALQNGGIRAVFGYGWPMPGSVPWWENNDSHTTFDGFVSSTSLPKTSSLRWRSEPPQSTPRLVGTKLTPTKSGRNGTSRVR